MEETVERRSRTNERFLLNIWILLTRVHFYGNQTSRFVKRILCLIGQVKLQYTRWLEVAGKQWTPYFWHRRAGQDDGMAKETGARYKSIYRCANTRYRRANWYRRVTTIPLGILGWTRASSIVGLVIFLREAKSENLGLPVSHKFYEM